MDTLEDLKRQTLLGQESLNRTKQQIDRLHQDLERERQQRFLDEKASLAAKAKGKILQQIAKNCIPNSENHLLTLLNSQGLLEIEGDQVFVKTTDRYHQPTIVPLEVGLSKLIQERFPYFLAQGEEMVSSLKEEDAVAPNPLSESSREKLESMTDQELLSLMSDPEKMTGLVNAL